MTSEANQSTNTSQLDPYTTSSCTFFLLLTSLGGIVGNSLIFYAVYSSKLLRNTNNALIVSLAVSDTLCATVTAPCMVYVILLMGTDESAKNSKEFCHFIDFCQVLSSVVQLVSLVSISYERYQAIAKPFTEAYIKLRRTKILISFAWVSGITAAVSVIFLRNPLYLLCNDVTRTYHTNYFTIVLLAPLTYITVIVISALYAKILLGLNQHSKSIGQNKKAKVIPKESDTGTVAFVGKVSSPSGAADNFPVTTTDSTATVPFGRRSVNKSKNLVKNGNSEVPLNVDSLPQQSGIKDVTNDQNDVTPIQNDVTTGNDVILTDVQSFEVESNSVSVPFGRRTDIGASVAFGKGASDSVPFGKGASDSVPFGKGASASVPFERGASAPVPFGKAESDSLPCGKGASDSVPFGKTSNDSVLFGKVASDSVPVERGASDSVPFRKEANNTVPFGKGASDSVPFGKGASDSVPFGKGASDSVPFGKGVSDSVPFGKGASDSVPSGKGASDSVPFGKGASDSVPFGKGASDSVPFGKGASDSVPLGKGASDSVPFGKEASDSVPFGKGASDPVPFGKGASDSVPFGKGASDSVPFGKGAGDSVPFGKVASDSVPFGKGANDTVPFGKNKAEGSNGTVPFGKPTENDDSVAYVPFRSKKSLAPADNTKHLVEVVDADGRRKLAQTDNAAVVGSVCVMNNKNKIRGRQKLEARAAKRASVLIIVFLCCWVPLPSVYLVTTFVMMPLELLQSLEITFLTISLMASALNPLMFAFTNRQYKMELTKILSRWKSKCKREKGN